MIALNVIAHVLHDFMLNPLGAAQSIFLM